MFDPLFAHCMFDKLSARLGVHAVPSCREETANFLVVRWCFVCQHKYTGQKMMKHVWQHVCSLHYASNSASGQTACILSTEETGMEGGKGGNSSPPNLGDSPNLNRASQNPLKSSSRKEKSLGEQRLYSNQMLSPGTVLNV